MKNLISIIIGILCFIGIFKLDSILIDYIINNIPKSGEEWYGIIRVILWVLAIIWTTGLAILCATFGGFLTRLILGK